MKELTIQEFSKEVGVSHDAITRLVKVGIVKARKKNPFGRTAAYFIPLSELERYRRMVAKEQEKRQTRSLAQRD